MSSRDGAQTQVSLGRDELIPGSSSTASDTSDSADDAIDNS